MFSELCRETLRKAAVCYSSGRSSASPSPSPPSSPPPSPSKEPTTSSSSRSHHHHHHHHHQHQHHHHYQHSSEASVTIETRDVGCSSRAQSTGEHHQQDAAGGSHFSRRSISPPEIREKRAATPTNVSSGRRTSGLESRDGRRPPYAATVDYSPTPPRESSSHQQHHTHQHHHQQQHHHYQCHRRGRSASPEMLRSFGYEEQTSQQHSPGSSPEPDDNSSTSGDEAGAANDENGQRSSSAHNRHSLTKGRESTGGPSAKDLDRAKLVRDRQNQERQRKLEELRQQALAAQHFREQREEERRKRIEELRTKDYDRRSQVEERKRLIWEAERERREAILRKNQEREARIEAKRKNERSHIVFAFGSSTPRMLEPADTGGASFWGTRRATSTTNVMMFSAAQPLTRRSSERELDGSKKRATSAGGLDRKPGEGDDNDCATLGTPGSVAAGCVTRYANRRRTDLMPTIPSPRESSNGPTSSGRSSSAKSFARSPGIRSGEATPNSPSRPHSSMSQQSGTSSVASSSVNLRPRTGTPRRPRPASIAGTGVSVSSVERNNTTNDTKLQKDSKPPLPKVHSSSTPKKPSTTSTPGSVKSTAERKSAVGTGATRSARASPRVTPRATPLQSPGIEQPPLPQLDLKQHKTEERELVDEKPQQVSEEIKVPEPVQVEPKKEDVEAVPAAVPAAPAKEEENLIEIASQQPTPVQQQAPPVVATVAEKKEEPKIEKKSPEPEIKPEGADLEEQCDMTASMIQKIRITTEDEAKAALAERRRLAREQAEREAALERQRLEEEARLEEERLRAEEEEQRRLEEETLRLAQEAREAEEQRLQQAIEEAKKREEEDRKRREEEARQKLEKEEAERKAREEAEKQRLEMVERLKKEEEERNARRKRVEAIMSRTRAKNQAGNAQKGEGDGEKSKEESPSEENKPGPGDKAVQDLMTASLISEATQQLISSEQRAHHTDSNNLDLLLSDSNEQPSNNGLLRNGGPNHANGIADSSAKPQQQLLDNDAEELNGHHNNTNHGNGIDGQTIALDNATVKQNNVTNNLLDLSEFDTLSNSNSGQILLMQSSGVVEDSLNSNLNPTAIPFTPNFGMSNQANTNPFQDAFTNNKQDNQVPDLLS